MELGAVQFVLTCKWPNGVMVRTAGDWLMAELKSNLSFSCRSCCCAVSVTAISSHVICTGLQATSLSEHFCFIGLQLGLLPAFWQWQFDISTSSTTSICHRQQLVHLTLTSCTRSWYQALDLLRVKEWEPILQLPAIYGIWDHTQWRSQKFQLGWASSSFPSPSLFFFVPPFFSFFLLLLSLFRLSSPISFFSLVLEVKPPKIQLDVWGALWAPPSPKRSGAEPQP